MRFMIIGRNESPPHLGLNTCYLKADNWNDYSFVTSFDLSLHDELGQYHEVGGLRIGFVGQTEETSTRAALTEDIIQDTLPKQFFSLGISSKYYSQLNGLNKELREAVLFGLRDVVFNSHFIKSIENERVFKTSLLRDASLSIIEGKYKRLLDGLGEEIPFHFGFSPSPGEFGDNLLKFKVSKKPPPSLSTSVHALIGRNGAGKTTLLDKIVNTILNPQDTKAKVIDIEVSPPSNITRNYFSSIVSVSFSSFDSLNPPQEQQDPLKGTCFFYIGLKKNSKDAQLKTLDERRVDMCESLLDCFHRVKSSKQGENKKLTRFKHALRLLSSDQNIKSFELEKLYDEYLVLKERHFINHNSLVKASLEESKFRDICRERFLRLLPDMSSGHAIVLLTTFSLISTVDEKSLVLIDEPESHLHPPLLSAFIRALSWLLNDVNGVAVIATHSPVVIQEIPKSCVWKIIRNEEEFNISRPDIETFGENVGVLTREVFGLDVDKSGFITVIEDAVSDAVESGKSFEKIYKDVFDESLGSEGLIILRSMLDARGQLM